MNNSNYTGYKSRWILLGALAVAFLFASIYTFDSKLALLGDNASYYSLGKSIAQGEGYVDISKISKSPNNHYPPGYPVIISTFLIFSESIVAIKVLNEIFLAALLWLVFLLVTKISESYILGFVITLTAIFNSHLLFYSSLIMSEIPYMFFSLLAIYFYGRINFEGNYWKDKNWIIVVLATIMAYYVRSLGIALLAGFCLHMLLNKRIKLMGAFISAFVIGALPWFIRGQSMGGASYMNQLKLINPYNPGLGDASMSDFIDRVLNNFSRYVTREIPDSIFTFGPDYRAPISGATWVFGLILLILIGYGIYKTNKYRWTLVGYLLGTFGILMIWPEVWIGVRFIVPIIPILFFGLFNGILQLKRSMAEKSALQYLGLGLLLITASSFVKLHETAKAPFPPAWQRYFEVAQWMKNNENGKVVGCGKPSLFYTYAGDNFTMRYKFTQDAAELLAHLERQKVDYVVIDQVYGNTLQYLLPAVRQYPNRFEQVLHLKNPDTFLLKFKR
ncbi:MAG: hypothetical protein RLO12_16590 [Fulvivirga sp.]